VSPFGTKRKQADSLLAMLKHIVPKVDLFAANGQKAIVILPIKDKGDGLFLSPAKGAKSDRPLCPPSVFCVPQYAFVQYSTKQALMHANVKYIALYWAVMLYISAH